MKLRYILTLLFLAVLLAACGSEPEPVGNTPSARGEALFAQAVIGNNFAPGCATCHSLTPGELIVGPSIAGVASRANEIILDPAYTGTADTVEAYLHESILEPNAHIVAGFDAGLMHQSYRGDLTDGQLGDLVAYLLTLE